jgi:transcription elongation factor Elf1
MNCPNCGTRGVIKIRITLHTAERLLFNSCNKCEHKWWQAPEEGTAVLDLSDVLDRVALSRSA